GGQRDNVFLIPQVAVTQTESGYLVFVLDAQGKAELRPVKVGDWVGKDWTILDGLKKGDKVVVDNLLKLRPGSAVAPVAAQ
ncbi:MAG: efflux RND transporter periplasmic adaptor subunit, partial [Usitatibacter sp.]